MRTCCDEAPEAGKAPAVPGLGQQRPGLAACRCRPAAGSGDSHRDWCRAPGRVLCAARSWQQSPAVLSRADLYHPASRDVPAVPLRSALSPAGVGSPDTAATPAPACGRGAHAPSPPVADSHAAPEPLAQPAPIAVPDLHTQPVPDLHAQPVPDFHAQPAPIAVSLAQQPSIQPAWPASSVSAQTCRARHVTGSTPNRGSRPARDPGAPFGRRPTRSAAARTRAVAAGARPPPAPSCTSPPRRRMRHQPAQAQPCRRHPVRQAGRPLRSHRPHRRDQRMAARRLP